MAALMPSSRVLAVTGVLLVFLFSRMARLEGWDNAFFVAQLTSVVGDGDLMLQDDLLAVPNPLPLKFRTVVPDLAPGVHANSFGIGVAVLHASYLWPIVLATSDLAGAFRAAASLGSMALLVATVLLTVEILVELGYARAIAWGASLLPVLCGPLSLYGTRISLNSHLAGAFCAALLVLALLRWLETAELRQAAAAGLAGGLLCIVRWQDALVVLACAPAVIAAVAQEPAHRPARLRGVLLAAAAGLAVVLIQLLAFDRQFGSWLLVPQGQGFIDWAHPHIALFLTSSFHGALPWAPGLLLGLLTLPLARAGLDPHRRRLVDGLLIMLPVFIYVCSAADWAGGSSFGPRRLSTLTPVAAIGLAALLRRIPRRAAFALAGLLAAWGFFVTSAFLSGFDDLAQLRLSGWRPLMPGFSFSDAPGWGDRLVGLTATAAVVTGTAALFGFVRRQARAQRALVAGGLAWTAGWIVLLGVAAPSNAPLERAWDEALRGCGSPSALPRGVRGAAHFVRAVRAEEQGDPALAARHLREAATGDFPEIAPADLQEALMSAAFQDLLTVTRPRRSSACESP
jgi:hypothetical protein